MYKNPMHETNYTRTPGFDISDFLQDGQPLHEGLPVAFRGRQINQQLTPELAQEHAGVLTEMAYSYKIGGLVAQWTFAPRASHYAIINHELSQLGDQDNTDYDGHILYHSFNQRALRLGATCVASPDRSFLFVGGTGDYRSPTSVQLVRGLMCSILPEIARRAQPANDTCRIEVNLSFNNFGDRLDDCGVITVPCQPFDG